MTSEVNNQIQKLVNEYFRENPNHSLKDLQNRISEMYKEKKKVKYPEYKPVEVIEKGVIQSDYSENRQKIERTIYQDESTRKRVETEFD